MKREFIFSAILLITGIAIFISCRKEYSCENCIPNKPPIAKAGPDIIVDLPIDSIQLDGSSSSDPDGRIASFLWTKISGPPTFTIINSSASITIAKKLTVGSYQFELKVTDDKGSSSNDTLNVIVMPDPANRPPVANAGSDFGLNLPANYMFNNHADTMVLDGNGSTDPDNNIVEYVWNKVPGPGTSFSTLQIGTKLIITNLSFDSCWFALKVTDAGGLFSRDTVVIRIKPI